MFICLKGCESNFSHRLGIVRTPLWLWVPCPPLAGVSRWPPGRWGWPPSSASAWGWSPAPCWWSGSWCRMAAGRGVSWGSVETHSQHLEKDKQSLNFAWKTWSYYGLSTLALRSDGLGINTKNSCWQIRSHQHIIFEIPFLRESVLNSTLFGRDSGVSLKGQISRLPEQSCLLYA